MPAAPAEVKIDPANASWTLVLSKTVDDKPLTIYLATAEGKVKQAAATGYNIALHTVDASGLKVDAGTLKGTLKVTIEPDLYLPQDKKPIACEIQLDATATGTEAKGAYRGKCGDKDVSGDLTGKVAAPAGTLKSGALELVLWNALADGVPYLRDAAVTFTVDNGAARDARIRWRKGDSYHWTGKIDNIEIKPDAGAMTATIRATIDSKSAVIGGKYTFTLDAGIIGDFVYGTTKVQIDDKDRKTSYFVTVHGL